MSSERPPIVLPFRPRQDSAEAIIAEGRLESIRNTIASALFPSPPEEHPPQRVAGGEHMSIHVGPGGYVAMQELREDGTPGIALQVPPDEWNKGWADWFSRIVVRKQRRRRLRLLD